MADEPKKITAAACCIRGFFREEGDPVATGLAVLALERALVREEHHLEHFPNEDAGSSYEVEASHLLDPDAFVGPVSDEVGLRIMHVADWIKAAVLEKAPWIERLDREGRPLKLMKIGSLDRATAEADKEMRRFASRMASVAVCADDEEVHAELGDGWSLVRLLSPAALDRESGLMQHCIGQGAYDLRLGDEQCKFLSLRDPSGKPHATVELHRSFRNGWERVVQLQGKQNERPVERHLRRIRPWLRENAATVDHRTPGANRPEWWSGYVRDVAGFLIDVLDPPSSMHVPEEVVFVLEEGDVLPRELLKAHNVEIRLSQGRTSPVVMPRMLEVGGRLELFGKGTFVFGDKVSAVNLRAVDCRVENLPSDFEAHSTSFENSDVGTIPASARTRFLNLPNSYAVLERGFGTKVLNLADSLVDVLPRDLVVETLVISGCPLREIPDGTSVEHLSVEGTALRRIGRLEGRLYGLELKNVQPALRMQDEMVVAGEMRVVGKTFPIRLPCRLVVEGTLKIERAPGIELPPDLKVGRLISVDRCFDAIPDGTRVVQLLQLIDAGDVAVGEDCEFGDIVVIEAADAREAGRTPRMVSIDPDPAIVRIAADGTCERRYRSPSM